MAGSNISRRKLLASAATSVPLLALGVSPAMAKMSQASVAYQDTPKGDRTCATCGLFMPPSACKTVDGTVSPNGWCKIWVKKAG